MSSNQKSVRIYTGTIYCGLKNKDTGEIKTIQDAEAICQAYVDEVGLCVSITPTRFVYTKGCEDGVAVGFIQYPRFVTLETEIRAMAMELADKLMIGLEQYRVSVVLPQDDEIIMLSNPNKNLD